MATWLFEFNLGVGFVDKTSLVILETVTRRMDIHQDLSPTTNEVNFQVGPDASFVNALMAGGADVPMRITKDGTRWFTGYVQRIPETALRANLQNMVLKAYDPSILLKRKLTADYKKWSSTVSVIVGELLTLGGVTSQNIGTISKTIDAAAFPARSVTYFEAIEKILSDFGYVLWFDETGTARTFLLYPSAAVSTKNYQTGEAGNIDDELKVVRKGNRFGGARVTFYRHESRTNLTVFSDQTNAGNQKKCNIDLTQYPNGYPGRSGTEDVYCEYAVVENQVKRELLATNSVGYSISGAGITVSQFVDYGLRAAVKITGSGTIYSLDIVAGSAILQGAKIIKESIISGVSEDLEDYQAEYLTADADADYLISGRRAYWANSGVSFTFKTSDTVALGAVVTIIDSTSLGYNLAALVAGYTEDDQGFRRVRCEALVAYSAQAVTTTGEAIESPNPPNGVPIVQIADITAPTVPGGLSVTQLSTGALRVSFTASTDSESGVAIYRVYRRETSTTNEAVVADVNAAGAGPFTLDDTSPKVGKSYQYAVSAVDARGNESAKTAWSSSLASVVSDPPGAVAGLQAAAVIGTSSVKWTAQTDAIAYQLEKSTDSGSTWLATGGWPLTVNTNSYADPIPAGTDSASLSTWRYRVKAISKDAVLSASYSSVASVTVATAWVYTPTAPTITGSIAKRSATLVLTKQANLADPDGWDVQISRDAANWYAPNLQAASDADNWQGGALNSVLTVFDSIVNLDYLPIPLVSGLPTAAGQPYYLRARARGKNYGAGVYCSPTSALVAYPGLYADLAAQQIKTANLDAEALKVPGGMVGFWSGDQMPVLPDNTLGSLWTRTTFTSADLPLGGASPTATSYGFYDTSAWNGTGAIVNGQLKLTKTTSAGGILRISVDARSKYRVMVVKTPVDVNMNINCDGTGYPVAVKGGQWNVLSVFIDSTGSGFVDLEGFPVGDTYISADYIGDGSYASKNVVWSNPLDQASDISGYTPLATSGTAPTLSIASGYLTVTGGTGSEPRVVVPGSVSIAGSRLARALVRRNSASISSFALAVYSPGYQNIGANEALPAVGTWAIVTFSIPSTVTIIASLPFGFGTGNYDVAWVDVSDGAFGPIPDASGNGKTLSLQPGAVRKPGPGGIWAIDTTYGGAYGSDANLPIGNSARSIPIWFNRPAGTPGTEMLLVYGTNSVGQAVYLYLLGNNLAFEKLGTAVSANASAYYDGKWHLAELVFDGTNARVDIDGVQFIAPTAYSFATVAGGTIAIGYDPFVAGRQFKGLLAEPRIYPRGLTTAEGLGLYQNPTGGLSGIITGDRMVANTVTAREIAAAAITAEKIGVTNLDVDGTANVIRLNAELVYSAATALVGSAQGTRLLSSGPASGKYAYNYFDLTAGKFRVGDANNYLYYDGSGNLEMRLTTFKVSSLATTVKGPMDIFTTGTLEAPTNVLRLTSDATRATISHPARFMLNNPGVASVLYLGDDGTGKTQLILSTSADTNGYAALQAQKVSGTTVGDLVLQLSGGNVGVGLNNPSRKLDVTGTGRFTGVLTLSSTTASSSTTTGALVVSGGVGVAGALFVGAALSVTSEISLSNPAGGYGALVPAGSVVMWTTASIPAGWLNCDGQAVSRTTYSKLFTAIGTTYGTGDGSTTFNVPDLRSASVRGVGTPTRFTDATAVTLNQTINDQLQTHTHQYNDLYNGYMLGSQVGSLTDWAYINNSSRDPNTGNNTGRTGAETTGKAVGLYYIIKV